MSQKPTWKSTLEAFLYLLPMLIFILTFNIVPIFQSLNLSFVDNYSIFLGEGQGYTLDNYTEIFQDPDFFSAIKNTFVYAFSVVFLSTALSLLVAVLLNNISFLHKFFRSVYFLPFVTSTVAISLVWNWLYHSRYGLVNYFLSLFGIDSIAWLTDPNWSMPALIIMSVWKGLGYNIILFLVGLNNIDNNLYKAAEIDGAGTWQKFRRITLPLLSPTIVMVMTIGLINGFKVFDEVYSLFNGRPGPGNSVMTMVYYIFEKFYTEFNYGEASAAGVVLFLIILIFTLLLRWVSKFFVYNKK